MAAWQKVKAWMVATVPTAPGLEDVTVLAGINNTGNDPARSLEVGYVAGQGTTGMFTRQQADDGTVWEETGEVHSTITAWNGNSDGALDAEDAAFAISDALDSFIAANRRLGGLIVGGAVTTSVEVVPSGNAEGYATQLIYVVHYTTIA